MYEMNCEFLSQCMELIVIQMELVISLWANEQLEVLCVFSG